MDLVAHYRILDRIGSGGLGDVFRARDTRLGRTVALKILPAAIAGDPARRTRFVDESRPLLALSHPNVATLFDVGEDAGRVFLAYEFVPGETLRSAIGGRPLNPRVAVELAVSLADALAEAHAQGMVHAELRPENVIVTPRGHAKILDFGMAGWTLGGAARAALAAGDDASPSLASAVAPYMSPEQAVGSPVDHRTDVFSLGVVFYEMLTGRSPFQAGTPAEALVRAARQTPPAPSAVNARVPAEADAIVEQALHKSREQRYQSAVTLAAELRSLAAILEVREDALSGEPMGLAASRPRPWRRAMAGALVLAVLVFAAWNWGGESRLLWKRAFGPLPAPVLTLAAESEDPARAYLVQGFAEGLIDRFLEIPAVTIVDRWRLRAPAEPVGGTRASAVLSVSVEGRGDVFEVDAALTDEADGLTFWRGSFERRRAGVFGLQSEVAEAVARALRVEVATSPARARASARLVEPAAYDLYLRARAAAARRDWPIAVEFYRRATLADEGLVEAYVGLTIALHERALASGSLGGPEVAWQMQEAASRAAAGDPDLPRAQLALGLAAAGFRDAAVALRRAIDLDPSSAEAYRMAGDLIAEVDPGLARRLYERAAGLDAGLPGVRARIALARLRSGEADAAIAVIEAAGEREPGMAGARALLEIGRGRLAAAADVPLGVTDLGPPAALARVLAIGALRGEEDAFEAAQSVAFWFPDFCDAEAVVAGLQFDRGFRAAAQRTAGGLAARAQAPGAGAAVPGCAAMAAAAVRNAGNAAAWLRRMAGSEPALRAWVSPGGAIGRHTWLRKNWYPWAGVAQASVFIEAVEQLETAVSRLRRDAADAFGDLNLEP